ncbi:polysaccharide lyase [Saccharophagus degradans]|uniref:Polysaccharide lyase 14 domain-containing protein n=1 Tax=Saccharophagus degradans (strain 2-40 / ATCC 43961 / DSM 17024) TaxID=203122 RepID=Q21PH8_SACD2|nr:hypothetical protein [Saccharophagus degradans]ABD79401.1 hypothetical protein Sde_0137 [Saccharophagus degradans 2-40]
MRTQIVLISTLLALPFTALNASPLECTNWQTAHPNWLWCDDFEVDSSLEENYFEVYRANGRYGVDSEEAFGGNASLRSDWVPGSSDAGNLKFSFGRTPVAQKRYTDTNFETVHWRFYMKTDSRWQGQGNKIARAISFAGNNWSQAMIAHLWQGSNLNIAIDPASGTARPESSSAIATTGYNDFNNLKWLGKAEGTTDIYSDENKTNWHCIEVGVELNTLGQADGTFKLWINDELEAERTNLNWRSSFDTYGINAIFLENYKGGGSSAEQSRFVDNLVISTEKIGCVNALPSPPITPPNFDVEEK